MADFYSNTANTYYLQLRVTERNINIANNTSIVDYKLWLCNGTSTFELQSTGDLYINGVKVWSISGSNISLLSRNSSVLLASGSRTISHNSDGSKSIRVSSSFRTNMQGTAWTVPQLTQSNNFGLATIPRASNPSLSASTTNLGSAVTINMNRKSSAFTHHVSYKIGGKSGVIAKGVTTSTSWTLPNDLATEITGSRTRAGTITVQTYNGSKLIGTSSVTFTAQVPNTSTFQPQAIIQSITEAASLPSIFDASLYIQTKSRLKVVAGANYKYGAKLSACRISIDGVHSSATTYTSNVLMRSGSVPISVRITDTRGLTHTVSTSVNVVRYFAPEILSFDAYRSPNDQSDKIAIAFNTTRANVASKNSRRIIVKSKRSDASSWTTLLTETNTSMDTDEYRKTFTPTQVFDTDYSYDIRIELNDAFTTVSIETTIGTAFELINWNNSGRGMAIGKVSERNTFEIGLDAEYYKNLTQYDASLFINGGTVTSNYIVDSRSVNENPDYYYKNYPRTSVYEFKYASTVGITGQSGTYVIVQTIVAWTGASGGHVKQLAHGNTGELYYRTGTGTVWGAWSRVGGVDNIIDYGSNWVKYESGKAECTFEFVSQSLKASSHTTVYTNAPFAFVQKAEETFVTAMPRTAGANVQNIRITRSWQSNGRAMGLSIENNRTSAQTATIQVLVKGYWK